MIYAKHGNLIRFIYLTLAVWWFVVTLGGRLAEKTKVVLCYHGVLARQKERFKWQMAGISAQATFYEKRKGGSQHHNGRFPKVCVTFDDAFANLLDNALPVLEKYCIPATVFAVPGNLGEIPCWKMLANHSESYEKTMTADQLVSLSKNHLIKIGSHTLTHSNLVEILPQQAIAELADSKGQLEALLGYAVEELALPYGAYNAAVLTMAQEAGYKRVYSLDPKPVDLEASGAVIGRFSMSPDVWKIEFMLTCAGAYAWLRPWRRFVRQVRLLYRFRK